MQSEIKVKERHSTYVQGTHQNAKVGNVLLFLWGATRPDHMCYEGNFRALKMKIEELEDLLKDVKEKTQMAEIQSMQNQVTGWVTRVETLKTDVDDLISHATQDIGNSCLGGYIPKNCWSRYNIGKEIDEKMKLVNEQKSIGQKFPLESNPSDTVWGRFLEKEKAIFALYGPGGAGKTAILSDLYNKLLTSNVPFDFKIWVVVSKDPNPERIQADIGKEMGFLVDRWGEKTMEEKAREVSEALSHKNFVLMLDDIWQAVDLNKIGVPTPSPQNGSKLAFTTRFEQVCEEMGAEEKIKVGSLAWEKAWELFRENLGEDALRIHSCIPDMAEKIAKMCNGLPLSLVIVARAMACKKTLEGWYQSVEDLSNLSKSGVPGMSNQVALLKFGYDNLPSDKARSCFLYFGLFPEGSVISKSALVDYWVGEGFAGESRNEGYGIILTLLHACLLEQEGKDVKMHDLVRDLALWIACKSRKEHRYLVQSGEELEAVPDIREWEEVRRVSLMGNCIVNLSNAPRCDDLRTLLLGKNNLKIISGSFFHFMPSLKVLDLSENRDLTELPSEIWKLNSLQFLNLSKTGLKQLPHELKNLVRLKYLNLEYTYDLHIIPMEVIPSFLDLNVLRMFHSASSDQTGWHKSLASHLQGLKHLNFFTITIRSESSLRTFSGFSMFQECTQALSLQDFMQAISLDILFLKDMKCLNEFELIDCINLRELSIDYWSIWGNCFDSLLKVTIVNCPKLEDVAWLALAPNIEYLKVARCSNLLEIIGQGRLAEGSHNVLNKLEVLQLVSLPNLKSIHPKALAFPCLKEIVVDDCPLLKRLPLNSNSVHGNGRRIVIQGWEDWWRMLGWENEAARRTFLPSFKACIY